MPDPEPVGATRALADAVRGLRCEDISDDAREVARHCLLDFLGCALAGSREPLTEILVREIVQREGSAESCLIGHTGRAARLTAALVNGAAGHALDFDDTHTMMGGHPSVPVLPALLALTETERVNGAALLTALVAGIELECRLGLLLGAGHYLAGFHATGTLGTFGAAAACAHLMHLDGDQWLHALGLAGTQAAGLRSGFGTMAKPLHAGRAASAGLLSALLARGGFAGQPAILEAAHGFAGTHAGGDPAASMLAQCADRFLIRNTLFKFHAACYLSHAAIEAAAQLRRHHGLNADGIRKVEVHVAPTLLDICNIQEPSTGLEGKFSLRVTTALALLGEDTTDLATFSDAKMRDPQLIALRDRVLVATRDLAPTEARVVIDTGAKTLEVQVDTGVPATDLAVQRERLQRKFLALATPVLGANRANRLADAALHVEGIDCVSDLLRLTLPQ
jgi:2-methylcitrate dehydratase PrpD